MTNNVPLAASKRPKKKLPTGKPRLVRRRPPPTLRFTPYAWSKLLYLRDAGPTEIGGFGVSAPGDPLLIQDVRLISQKCDWASVCFDDGAVADYFDEQVDLGRTPESFGRVWVHTHPGQSPSPSATDEETLARVFGNCDWAVMFILAQGGGSYARLELAAGPGASVPLPVEIDYRGEFPASDQAAWQAEYQACVIPLGQTSGEVVGPSPAWDAWSDDDRLAELWRDAEADDGYFH